MSYPADYDPNGLAPVIEIRDKDGLLRYIYEHPQADADPEQDFKVLSWSIKTGINSDAGLANVVIEDHQNELTEAGKPIFRNGDQLRIKLGKTPTTLQYWFSGIINEPQVNRPGHARQQITIAAFGMFNTLSYRIASVNHSQRITDDGTYDDADDASKVSELAKKVITSDTIHLIPGAGVPVTTNGIADIDIKVPSFQHMNVYQDTMIEELANIANTTYGIDPDIDFFFHTYDTYYDFLVTNNLNARHDPTKTSYIRNTRYAWHDSSKTTYFTDDIVFGAFERRSTTTNNTYNDKIPIDGNIFYGFGLPTGLEKNLYSLSFVISIPDTYVLNKAWRYNPTMRLMLETKFWVPTRIFKLAANYTYASGSDRFESSVYNNAQVEGVIDLNPWIQTFAELSNTRNNPTWFTHTLTQEKRDEWNDFFEPDHTYAMMAYKNPLLYPNLNLHYDTTLTPDRIYTPRLKSVQPGGQVACQITHESPVIIRAYNTVQRNISLPIQRPDNHNGYSTELSDSITEGLMETIGKKRRTFTPVLVSAPSARPPVGKLIHFHDSHLNLDMYPRLQGYTIRGDINNRLAPTDMLISLESYI